MTPAGNGLGAPQSLAALLPCATPHPERKNAPSGPCGGWSALQMVAWVPVDGNKSRLRALEGKTVAPRGAALAADAAAPNSLIQEPKVGKPNNHAGSQGGRP